MSYLKYQSLISKCWDYPLPVLTKSGKPSFHRKGIRNGKVRLKDNPLWEKDYINSINIDRPTGLSKREVLKMTYKDVNCKGFWSNPFLYTEEELITFNIDTDNYYPEKLYYNWLNNTEEGKLRRLHLGKLKLKYLITNNLLQEPLRYCDPMQHHGQVLLLLLSSCERFVTPKWQPYSYRSSIVEPSLEALRRFYLSQIGIESFHKGSPVTEPKKLKESSKQQKQLILSLS